MRPLLLVSLAVLSLSLTAVGQDAAAAAPDNMVTPSQQINVTVAPDFGNSLMSADGTSGFGGSQDIVVPKLVQSIALSLPQDVLAKLTGATSVTVEMTVDRNGVPKNMKIAHSGGAEVDESAMAAVKQFRFKPGSVDHSPVDAEMTVDVKIEK